MKKLNNAIFKVMPNNDNDFQSPIARRNIIVNTNKLYVNQNTKDYCKLKYNNEVMDDKINSNTEKIIQNINNFSEPIKYDINKKEQINKTEENLINKEDILVKKDNKDYIDDDATKDNRLKKLIDKKLSLIHKKEGIINNFNTKNNLLVFDNPLDNIQFSLSKKELFELIKPLYFSELLYKEHEKKNLCIDKLEEVNYKGETKIISKNSSKILNDKSQTNKNKKLYKLKEIKIIKVTEKKKLKKPKPLRMLNRDCMMKKIKSRFFKYFANQYMIKFSNHVNAQTMIKFTKQLYFKKMNNYFLVYASIKKHLQWRFTNKTILELFHDHSDMELSQVLSLYANDKNTFSQMVDGLDEVTKFVILQPFKDVYNQFIADKDLLECFLDKMKNDLIKRNSTVAQSQNSINKYYVVFKKNIFNLINYYSQ